MNRIKKIRSRLLEFMTHNVALPIVLNFRNNEPFNYTMEELEKFPIGTLGKDLADQLNRNGLVLLKHYERHDCKHIILQYPMDELGEASMQFYFFGNRHYSVPVLDTVSACLIMMPDYWRIFIREFKKGRKGKSFDGLNYNVLVHQKTEDLRKEYGTNISHK